MFEISDQELDGIESGKVPEARQRRTASAGMPMAGMGGLGEEEGAPSPGPAPTMAPIVRPQAADDSALRRGAGRALAVATVGLVGGALVGGAFGAASGVIAVGAVRNLMRTKETWNHPDPAVRSEAGKSATMAIFGLGIAGMLGYQAYKKKEEAL